MRSFIAPKYPIRKLSIPPRSQLSAKLSCSVKDFIECAIVLGTEVTEAGSDVLALLSIEVFTANAFAIDNHRNQSSKGSKPFENLILPLEKLEYEEASKCFRGCSWRIEKLSEQLQRPN